MLRLVDGQMTSDLIPAGALERYYEPPLEAEHHVRCPMNDDAGPCLCAKILRMDREADAADRADARRKGE